MSNDLSEIYKQWIICKGGNPDDAAWSFITPDLKFKPPNFVINPFENRSPKRDYLQELRDIAGL